MPGLGPIIFMPDIIANIPAGGMTPVPISIHEQERQYTTSIHLEFDQICGGELLWNFIILLR